MTLDQATEQDVVPDNREELSDWAYILQMESLNPFTHRYALLYASPSDANELRSVSIRLQGFVHSCDLSTLGDWKG